MLIGLRYYISRFNEKTSFFTLFKVQCNKTGNKISHMEQQYYINGDYNDFSHNLIFAIHPNHKKNL